MVDRQTRVLVIRSGALGDTILTLPAISALRGFLEKPYIEVAGNTEYWRVAGCLVDRIRSIEDPVMVGFYSGNPGEKLKWLDGFDLVISWTQHDPTPMLRAAGVPCVIHASPYPPPGAHAAAWLLESLRSVIGAPPDPQSWRLPLEEDELRGGEELLREWGIEHPVVLHPGAGAEWKRWPAERFAAVTRSLQQHGYPVVLTAGPADEAVIAVVLDALEHKPPVLRNLPPHRLAAVLQSARLFIGNDSGVTHLAGVAGTSVLALFGPTDPLQWGPLGDVTVLRACPCRATVQGEIRICSDPDCMARLGVDTVLEMALELLVGY